MWVNVSWLVKLVKPVQNRISVVGSVRPTASRNSGSLMSRRARVGVASVSVGVASVRGRRGKGGGTENTPR